MATRRNFLTGGAAFMAAGLATGLSPLARAWAGAALDLGGGASVQTLHDGNLVLPGSFVYGDSPEEQAKAIIARYGLNPNQLEPDCNVTLYRDGTNTVIFDVGSGPDFMSTAGKLPEALDQLGLAAEDVTHVIFTHGHPDHLWGLLDDFDEPFFANAQHMMGQAEFDYWTDENTLSTIGQARQTFAAGAKRRLDMIADRMSFFRDGEEIVPGVAARATFGHTPGHMSYEIRKGSESVMVLGDCIANHHLAFEQPGWHSGSDQDGDLGAKTRVALLDQLAQEQMRFIGFHLPHPGFGRAERKDGAYRFVAEA
ncbi:MBL fold metallo-hydrolase [Acidimangrovimonas pyrenivorans]|uniref:MBL fold metallo-hydrolase n=1 Tax=Acidimangrovimonas pyrenivorans TaxID=2030798 RepID=A0ABV7ADP6_9RHOB